MGMGLEKVLESLFKVLEFFCPKLWPLLYNVHS